MHSIFLCISAIMSAYFFPSYLHIFIFMKSAYLPYLHSCISANISSKERSFYLVQTNEIEPLTSLLWIRNRNFGTNPHPLSLNKWGDFHWHRFFLKTLIGFYHSRRVSWSKHSYWFSISEKLNRVFIVFTFLSGGDGYIVARYLLKSIALLVLKKSIGF